MMILLLTNCYVSRKIELLPILILTFSVRFLPLSPTYPRMGLMLICIIMGGNIFEFLVTFLSQESVWEGEALFS